jgi:hypothetical protein
VSKQLISKHDLQQIALRDMRAFPESERGTDVEIEYQPDSTQRNELDDPYCHARGSWQPRENRRREQSGEGSSRSVSFLFTDFMEGVEREALLPATPHRSHYCQTARAGVPPSERLWGRAYDAKRGIPRPRQTV